MATVKVAPTRGNKKHPRIDAGCHSLADDRMSAMSLLFVNIFIVAVVITVDIIFDIVLLFLLVITIVIILAVLIPVTMIMIILLLGSRR